MAFESVRATAEERSRPFPGDGLADQVLATWTHGVSIAAPPRAIWPWLAQMGSGRGGWYSWDRLDNGGRRSAGEVLPSLVPIAVGDVLPAAPGVSDAFVVERVEPGRELLLGVRDGGGGRRATWEFLLDPVAEERTRLLVRVRVSGRGWMTPLTREPQAAAAEPGLIARMPRGPVLAAARVIHRVMQARQLRGIRRRAEALANAEGARVAAKQGPWAHHGMNVVGQGGRIMLLTAPALIAAVIVHRLAPELAHLPLPGVIFTPLAAGAIAAGLVLWGAAVGQLLLAFPRGRLVTSGAYGVCRNPIYASVALLVLPGVTLATATWVYLMPALMLYLAVQAFIGLEERDLLRVFGDGYLQYAERVPRFFPLPRPPRAAGRTGRAAERAAPTTVRRRFRVEGQVAPGFEEVRDVFAENFTQRHELGGACCAYVHGQKVVDLWGGVRDRATGEPWERDTMTLVYSATKGLAAMTLAVAHSRGWLDYEARVATYWPEFAANGKERITVRQLLGHQAGLFAFDEPVDRAVVADLDRLAAVMARQRPAWEPGTWQGYHVISLGFYEGELLRRIDPRHRTLGQFFQEEVAAPLGLDFHIRLPASVPDARLAPLAFASPWAMLLHTPPRFLVDLFDKRSNLYRAGAANPGTELPRDAERIYARELEVPSGGGVGTARAIARAYGVFASGGAELGLRSETLRALEAPATPPRRGFHDQVVRGPVKFSLGFMKPSTVWPFGPDAAYGAPGSGGSLGFADPLRGLGYGYVTCQAGPSLTGDPREVALRRAIYAALPAPGVAERSLVEPWSGG